VRIMFSGVMAGVIVLMAAGHALAHHAFAAEYDAKKRVTLQGVVTKMEWINPHSWLHVDVKNPDGKVEEWLVEGGPPNALFRRGLSKDALAPGTQVTIEGARAKDGTNKINGSFVRMDGKKLFLGSSGTGNPDEPGESK
jgi:hypothetical protein